MTKSKSGEHWLRELRGTLLVLLAVLCFQTTTARAFYIPSESMMPTLQTGDRLIVSKYAYGWSSASVPFHALPFMHGRIAGSLPDRGDIVIVTPPGSREDYIKRVIALPGDRLEVRQGVVILNGIPVRRSIAELRLIAVDGNSPCDSPLYAGLQVILTGGERFCRMPIVRETLPNGVSYDTVDLGYLPADDFAEITIPGGQVFFMGDNRDNSADSRVSTIYGGLGGPLPIESIQGRAEFTTFSFSGELRVFAPGTWTRAYRGARAGLALRPAKSAG
jgi:signal peptidase I